MVERSGSGRDFLRKRENRHVKTMTNISFMTSSSCWEGFPAKCDRVTASGRLVPNIRYPNKEYSLGKEIVKVERKLSAGTDCVGLHSFFSEISFFYA